MCPGTAISVLRPFTQYFLLFFSPHITDADSVTCVTWTQTHPIQCFSHQLLGFIDKDEMTSEISQTIFFDNMPQLITASLSGSQLTSLKDKEKAWVNHLCLSYRLQQQNYVRRFLKHARIGWKSTAVSKTGPKTDRRREQAKRSECCIHIMSSYLQKWESLSACLAIPKKHIS